MAKALDYENMSASELMELAKQRKLEEARDPKRVEKIKALKEKFEKECRKEGLTLAQVFTFSEKRLEPVKGPNGEVWHRRGPKPQWLRDMEAESEGSSPAMKALQAKRAKSE